MTEYVLFVQAEGNWALVRDLDETWWLTIKAYSAKEAVQKAIAENPELLVVLDVFVQVPREEWAL